MATKSDTIVRKSIKKAKKEVVVQPTDTAKSKEFKPDPQKVIWMGAIVPGYGQIMNRKYWKLPIVYAGFLGFAYTITYNSIRYQAFKNGYRDIIDTDESTVSYLQILPKGSTIDDYGGKAEYTNVLKTGMEKYRYNRDLSVIISIAYYGLTLVDAFVDAQLYDFDISNDLSLNLKPVLIENQYGYRSSPGLQLCFNLK
ncbi:MAG TPA: DUF5683 domain-containing protein [Paludibacter sp.]|nr:DUF5683 domain-containing protein [Paludibacter sp.]